MASNLTQPVTKYKVVFLGDQSVGKTSIINRYINETFETRQPPTIGIDFISKTCFANNQQLRLLIWDTAGQERFKSLIPNYLRDAKVVILCYDITNQSSFDNINTWIKEVRQSSTKGNKQSLDDEQQVLIIIVANKRDLDKDRKVTQDQGIEKAKELNVGFMEVSALDGDNVQQLFQHVCVQLVGEDSSLSSPIKPSHNHHNNFQLTNKTNHPQKKQCKC